MMGCSCCGWSVDYRTCDIECDVLTRDAYIRPIIEINIHNHYTTVWYFRMGSRIFHHYREDVEFLFADADSNFSLSSGNAKFSYVDVSIITTSMSTLMIWTMTTNLGRLKLYSCAYMNYREVLILLHPGNFRMFRNCKNIFKILHGMPFFKHRDTLTNTIP